MPATHRYIDRLLTGRLKRLFANFSCVLLSGARQVGKSTLLQHAFPNLPVVVLDPLADVQGANSDPDLFLDQYPNGVILDEIQYAPELVPALKRRIDSQRKRPGLYLLTGSQQWGIINEICESMAGRVMLQHLDGFCLAELAGAVPEKTWLERWLTDPSAFLKDPKKRLNTPRPLYEHIWRGFLPEAQFIDTEFLAQFHASYQATYVERDIRLMAEISDVGTFGRFLRLVTANTAQEVNYSHLGREIGITPQTSRRWLQLLVHCFEWFEVPAYSANSVKKISLRPKGYFSDTGQVCYSQMISSPHAIAGHPLWGALFETAVVTELRKLSDLMPTPPRFYHWRLHSGAEVDLVLERDGMLFPIEIKAKSHPDKQDSRGIVAFRDAHPTANVQPGLILAPTETCYPVRDDVWVFPWDLA